MILNNGSLIEHDVEIESFPRINILCNKWELKLNHMFIGSGSDKNQCVIKKIHLLKWGVELKMNDNC